MSNSKRLAVALAEVEELTAELQRLGVYYELPEAHNEKGARTKNQLAGHVKGNTKDLRKKVKAQHARVLDAVALHLRGVLRRHLEATGTPEADGADAADAAAVRGHAQRKPGRRKKGRAAAAAAAGSDSDRAPPPRAGASTRSTDSEHSSDDGDGELFRARKTAALQPPLGSGQLRKPRASASAGAAPGTVSAAAAAAAAAVPGGAAAPAFSRTKEKANRRAARIAARRRADARAATGASAVEPVPLPAPSEWVVAVSRALPPELMPWLRALPRDEAKELDRAVAAPAWPWAGFGLGQPQPLVPIVHEIHAHSQSPHPPGAPAAAAAGGAVTAGTPHAHAHERGDEALTVPTLIALYALPFALSHPPLTVAEVFWPLSSLR